MVYSPVCRNLYNAVAVLGVAGYGVALGAAADGDAMGWPVRFAALAALAAVIGLIARQSALPHATAILAGVGFLDGLWSVVTTSAGWSPMVTVILNGLQAVAAVAALILLPKPEPSANEAYFDYYNQAVRQYYGQLDAAQRGAYGQAYDQSYGQAQGQAYGDAYGQAQTGAQNRAPAQTTTQYGDYADLLTPQQDYGRPTSNAPADPAAAAPPPGRAGAGPAQSPGAPARADDSARPSWPQ
ncbi:DUF5336 domain-containing protein [Mycobacterium sp. NPDC003449]